MYDYNDIIKNNKKKPEEINTMEKKQKKKKRNPKKMQKLFPYYSFFGKTYFEIMK